MRSFTHQINEVIFKSSKKRIVFLGTPDVSATCLQKIEHASKQPSSNFELIAVVTQPPAPAGRKLKLVSSPVQNLAEILQINCLKPESAKDEEFLDALERLKPDLCITAAYGNFFPKRFLDIPRYGTLNIHPSLLPLYRGAAPIQRCLENGDSVTGVTVAETVLKMDSGPIVAQKRYALKGDEKAPEMHRILFEEGTNLLLQVLPHYFEDCNLSPKARPEASTHPGRSEANGQDQQPFQKIEQNHQNATPANKILSTEAYVNLTAPSTSARAVHNRVRAFAGWPGVWTYFRVGDGPTSEIQRIKLITTTVLTYQQSNTPAGRNNIPLGKNASANDQHTEVTLAKVPLYSHTAQTTDQYVLRISCPDDSCIGVVEVQPPGKKVMDARSYFNGLRGRRVVVCHADEPTNVQKDAD